MSIVIARDTSLHADEADFICDGIDDHIQIQQAIDLVAFQSCKYNKILMLEGCYNLGATVRIKESINIQGLGAKATIISLQNNVNSNMFEFYEDVTNPSAGFIFEDIVFSGNCVNNTYSAFIDTKVGAVALWDLHLLKCFFFSFNNTAMIIRDPWGLRIDHCHIEDCEAGSILITAGQSKNQGIIITNNKIIQNTRTVNEPSIKLAGVNYATIIGNELNTSNGQDVILLNSSIQNQIIGNQFIGGEGSTTMIHCDSNSHGNTITGNVFAGGYNGVVVDISCQRNTIVANTFNLLSNQNIIDNGIGTIFIGNSI